MIAKRAAEMTSFIVMDVLEKAHEMERQGTDVIHLEVGEPDFDTPQCIIDAAEKALKDGYTHYTHSLGIIELREAICEYYANTYRVTIDPDQIIVTPGTSPAMFMLFATILEENDEVIISDPHYACYPNFIKFFKGVPVTVPVYENDGFQYRTTSIQEKICAKTKGIFINSPSNPTGNLLSTDRMQKIAELSPYIISDEIYHGLVYGEKAHSIHEFTDRAFIFNGFSKLYAMTGFRLGYACAPAPIIEAMMKIHQYSMLCAPIMSQVAAIEALENGAKSVIEMKQAYHQRRDYMVRRLNEMGIDCHTPGGAFYVFPNIQKFGMTSK